MKVLIVDDNVAVQEIIKDILVEEGHSTQVASNVDEAVDKIIEFQPAVIMLDTWVGDADGLRVVNRVHEENPDVALNVILIKSSNEQVPKDNPFIRGFIDKPFKSSDVVVVLNSVYTEIMEEQQAAGSVKKKHKPIFRLFKKKDEKIDVSTESIEDEGLSYGSSYVIFENEPADIYRFIGLFNPDVYSVLVVSSDKAKAVKERFGGADLDVITLTAGQRSDAFDIHGLGTLMSKINAFIKSKDHPVVVFDNMSDIVESDSLNQALVMVHQLITDKRERAVTFAVSMDPRLLTDKDRGILLHDMKQYIFSK